jgi:uncharacterized protein (TIGR02145 family)
LLVPEFSAGTISSVAVDHFQMCVIRIDGSAACAGWNHSGELGNGTTTLSYAYDPVLVHGLSAGTAAAISTGREFSCGLKTDGSVVCWGWNASSQLGDGTVTNRYVPTPVLSLIAGTITAIATGDSHTCAIKTDGSVLCWGYNGSGQLGDGTNIDKRTPVPLVMSVAASALSPTTPSPTPAMPTPTSLPCGSVTSAATATPTLIPTAPGLGCNGVAFITDNRDINNPVYETVEIGNQCWLKRNLNVGTYITGTATQTNKGVIEKYCYGNITANCDTYGGLYQYDEATNYYSTVPAEIDVVQGICPAGWHIPRDSEWNTLVAYLGGESVAGDKMKNFGLSQWYDPNITKNSSGFTAYGAGRRDTIGRFNYLGAVAFFWSSLSGDAANALYRHINSDESALNRVCYSRSSGVSVRCLKD